MSTKQITSQFSNLKFHRFLGAISAGLIGVFIFAGIFAFAVQQARALEMPTNTNDGVAAMVQSVFADAPAMIAVAQCESGTRQFAANGQPVAGGGGAYIGVFQISASIHAARALSMGMDIYTAQGNIQYARYLYDHSGTQPWFGCLPKTVSVPLPTSAPTPAPTVSTPTPVSQPKPDYGVPNAAAGLTLNLSFGMTNSQVILLQQSLNFAGFTVATSGAGSPGNETSRFGQLTRDAVKNFQCSKGIACSGNEVTTGYGRVGPKTRAAIIAAVNAKNQ